ncbi:MAG: hypothetical protein ACTSX9_07835 [Candidatus Njordarchaeales archaeon]
MLDIMPWLQYILVFQLVLALIEVAVLIIILLKSKREKYYPLLENWADETYLRGNRRSQRIFVRPDFVDNRYRASSSELLDGNPKFTTRRRGRLRIRCCWKFR